MGVSSSNNGNSGGQQSIEGGSCSPWSSPGLQRCAPVVCLLGKQCRLDASVPEFLLMRDLQAVLACVVR
jgi:hypothetical protein